MLSSFTIANNWDTDQMPCQRCGSWSGSALFAMSECPFSYDAGHMSVITFDAKIAKAKKDNFASEYWFYSNNTETASYSIINFKVVIVYVVIPTWTFSSDACSKWSVCTIHPASDNSCVEKCQQNKLQWCCFKQKDRIKYGSQYGSHTMTIENSL